MKHSKENNLPSPVVCSRTINPPGFSFRRATGLGLLFFVLCAPSFAAADVSSNSYSVERLASAIKLAENSKTKPYGIMRDYCHAGAEAKCRKGCIQTIQKRMKLWEAEGRHGDFIDYLAKTYAPTSGNLRSAEKSLNPHWPKNVKHFYRKGGVK